MNTRLYDWSKFGKDADPCVCGAFDTWHPECYASKTQAEIDAAAAKVWRELKKKQTSGRLAVVGADPLGGKPI